VTVPKDACRTLDFHRAAEMIALGRALTSEALDEAGLVSSSEGPEATGVTSGPPPAGAESSDHDGGR